MNKSSDPKIDPYQPDNIPLFNAIYGKNLISLGGLAAVDSMFSGVNLQGLTALDLGFGLGGVAFYLAEKYKMQIFGIEVNSWMVQYANKSVPPSLQFQLEFNTYHNENTFPYQPKMFDLVYSKGVLNHIANKADLFNQVQTTLKPNGLFVIADWIYPQAKTEDSAPLICETKETYEHLLLNGGFDGIHFRNDSVHFISYARALLARLKSNRDFIITTYGQELFLTIKNQHENLIVQMQNQQKIAARILAKKI